MSFGKKSPTTAATMMAASPPPAEAKAAEGTDAQNAQRENRARAQGIQSTYLRNYTDTSAQGGKQTLGS